MFIEIIADCIRNDQFRFFLNARIPYKLVFNQWGKTLLKTKIKSTGELDEII